MCCSSILWGMNEMFFFCFSTFLCNIHCVHFHFHFHICINFYIVFHFPRTVRILALIFFTPHNILNKIYISEHKRSVKIVQQMRCASVLKLLEAMKIKCTGTWYRTTKPNIFMDGTFSCVCSNGSSSSRKRKTIENLLHFDSRFSIPFPQTNSVIRNCFYILESSSVAKIQKP